MASTYQEFPHLVQGGVDQSVARHAVASGAWWHLLNLRPIGGRLVQPKGLAAGFDLTAIDGETASTVKLMALVRNIGGDLRYLIGNGTNLRFVDPTNTAVQVEIPQVHQVAVPETTGVTGECLLYGINVTDFAADGDTIEVKITSATTFQWRRNAGSWSSDLTIGPEVAIGSNGLKVSFQAAGDAESYDNFTTDDLWRWERKATLPGLMSAPAQPIGPYKVSPYNRDNYIAGVNRTILRVRDNIATTVGYKRVFGRYCTTLANHLIVAHYSAAEYDAVNGLRDPYDEQNTPYRLGWSHRNNPDQFVGTDINEADDYQLDEQHDPMFSNLGVTGLEPWRNQVYLFLPSAIYTMYYIGYPEVFKIDPLNQNIGSIFSHGTVRSPNGIYFIGRDNVYRIRGTDPEPIGWKVRIPFFQDLNDPTDAKFNRTWGMYDPQHQEVIWTYFKKLASGVYQARQMVFREESGEWFFRNFPSALNTGADDIFCGCPKYSSNAADPTMLYGGQGTIYQEATTPTLSDTVQVDATVGFVEPTAETGLISHGFAFKEKQINSVHLDAGWVTSSGVQVSVATLQNIGVGTVNFAELSELWTPETAEGRLTFQPAWYRHVAYRFKFTADAGLVAGAVLNMWEEYVFGLAEDIER